MCFVVSRSFATMVEDPKWKVLLKNMSLSWLTLMKFLMLSKNVFYRKLFIHSSNINWMPTIHESLNQVIKGFFL